MTQVNFIAEQVEQRMYEVIESTLKDKVYSENQVQSWVDDICSRLSKDLVDSRKPFKYIGEVRTSMSMYPFNVLSVSAVSCVIMQKNGAGLHSGHSCFWDAVNDNVVIARWPNEKRKDPNARLVCIASVYGVAF